MGKLFGTDGVRGVANRDLTGKLAMQIGQAAGMVVKNSTGRRPSVLVGKDTRISSDLLEAALTAGLCAAGADVVHLGVLPTPAVAYLVTKYSADAGIMISASHNPYPYNGIKIFNSQGYKLSDEQEGEIEQLVLGEEPFDPPAQDGEIGRVFSQEGRAAEDYAAYLCGTLAGDLSGLRVALDCANGSASVTAGRIFQSLGADCRILHAFPNGVNINDRCGSTHLESLRQAVLEGGFDVGLAFDGDADRCLAVDEQGGLVDGDRLMALFAYHLQSQGKLHHDTFVATVMSNLGLFKFAESHHMHTRSAQVGDRYVLETMLKEDFWLGGEQSGHIIFREFMTTGDGQLSGLQLLGLMKGQGKSLSQLAGLMKVYPQTLVNIHSTPARMASFSQDERVRQAIHRANQQWGENGRVLVRPSGTEPLIRVMVEGPDLDQIQEIAQELVQVIEG